MTELAEIWVYLSASPLLHLTMTLVVFQAAMWLYKKAGMTPLLNPVMLSVIVLVSLLSLTETDYQTYFDGAQFVHFLLGPATVALAIPLYRQFEKVRKSWLAITVSVIIGGGTAAATAIGVAWLLGGSEEVLATLAPKSVTAPVAMGIAEKLGGLPSLTPVFVMVTGIIGASLGPYVLNLLGIRDWAARGFAIGVASHGIGTARASQVNEVAGAFSGLAMGLNAIATAALLPLIWFWLV